MNKIPVGVIGCTGVVGQLFVSLLADHPWFELKMLAASERSAGKTYGEAVAGRWRLPEPPDALTALLPVWDAWRDARRVAEGCAFVFCAVDLPRGEVLELEKRYALMECPVVSNNSAHRDAPDVPMVIPEINPEHLAVIPAQRRRLGTKRGFVAVKSNCSIQSYVPALHPLMDLRPTKIAVTTFQAVSGAGKTLAQWPQMTDNIIPYIKGEEEKSRVEPLKIWGRVERDVILPARSPVISARCVRVPVSDGHLAAVCASFEKQAPLGEIIGRMTSYRGLPQLREYPTAPKRFIHYFEEPDRPQTALDRDLEKGMAISIGQLERDPVFDIRFTCLSHNTLRGAAGGGVLLAELLTDQGYLGAC